SLCYSVLCILAQSLDRGFRPCRKESPHIPVGPTLFHLLTLLHPVLRTHFQVPYPVSPVFATLAETARGVGILFPFWKSLRGRADEDSYFIQALSFHILAHSFAHCKIVRKNVKRK